MGPIGRPKTEPHLPVELAGSISTYPAFRETGFWKLNIRLNLMERFGTRYKLAWEPAHHRVQALNGRLCLIVVSCGKSLKSQN